MKKYEVIGLMSGTSLDGLDIACVQFTYEDKWAFKPIYCRSLEYDQKWKSKLRDSISLSGLELKKLDLEFGAFIGGTVKAFINEHHLTPDLIVSHGHTIFHQPEIGLTLQIGDGYNIRHATGIRTICDLRSMDVSLGGQGAPLVPLGDKLLFGNYDFCLNLGGFSNISFDQQGVRMAFDICPVNTVLNYLAAQNGQEFDRDGDMARQGKILPDLLKKLNNLSYYTANPPKSLGIEWVLQNIYPLLSQTNTEDHLHTFCHHIAEQIINVCNIREKPRSILITGGGAKNNFLLELLRKKSDNALEIVLPDTEIIDFKEAIIFAFLGLLRELGQINCLRSVTGASCDSSGGLVFDYSFL
jgi:anhydro-N-acetylmuramic acid kinase